MNKKFLAVAIPAALFAGSVSAYDVVTSDATTVGLSGKVGYEHKTVSGDAGSSSNKVTEGDATLNVAVKHTVNESVDALGGVEFGLKNDDKLNAAKRYIGVSLVGGEHVVKYGEVDKVTANVGVADVKATEAYASEGNVLRYTFSNDTLTVDASHAERAVGKANDTGLKVVANVDDFEVTAAYSRSALTQVVGAEQKVESVTGVNVKADFSPATVTLGYGALDTDGTGTNGVLGKVEYQLTDELELTGSYQVVSVDGSNEDTKTAKLGAEYAVDKWTYNADLKNVSGKTDSDTVTAKVKYAFTDKFEGTASVENKKEQDKDGVTTATLGLTLTW